MEDGPPFYDPNAPRLDEPIPGAFKTKPKKQKRNKCTGYRLPSAANALEELPEEPKEQEQKVRSGYVGKPKGLLDIAYERGWIDFSKPKGWRWYTLDGRIVDGKVDEETSVKAIIRKHLKQMLTVSQPEHMDQQNF